MSKKAGTVAVAAGAVLAAANLEAGPLPGFSLAAQTQHFSFYSRDREKIDAEKSERYLARVEHLLGQQVQGRTDYYRYGSAQELAAGTGSYASGVTFAHAGQIHSTREFHAHEIVHLVGGQMGDPGAFFQEGLAVVLGNQARWQGADVDKLARRAARGAPLRALVAGFAGMDSDIAYAVAGSFVHRLVRTHGLAKIAEFFRACRPGTDSGAAFARTFGESLDEAGTEWAASL